MTQTEEVTELVTLIKEITDVQMVTELTKRKAEEESTEERTVVETEVGTNLGVLPTVEGEVLRPGVVIDDPSLVEEILGESGGGGERNGADDEGEEEEEEGAIVVDMVLDRDALDVVLASKENGDEVDCGTKVETLGHLRIGFESNSYISGSVRGAINRRVAAAAAATQESTAEERGRRHCRHGGGVGCNQDDQDRLRAREGRVVCCGEREEKAGPGDGEGDTENQLFSWPTKKQRRRRRKAVRWSGSSAKDGTCAGKGKSGETT